MGKLCTTRRQLQELANPHSLRRGPRETLRKLPNGACLSTLDVAQARGGRRIVFRCGQT